MTLLNKPEDQPGTDGHRPASLGQTGADQRAVPQREVKVKVPFPFQKATKRENTTVLRCLRAQ